MVETVRCNQMEDRAWVYLRVVSSQQAMDSYLQPSERFSHGSPQVLPQASGSLTAFYEVVMPGDWFQQGLQENRYCHLSVPSKTKTLFSLCCTHSPKNTIMAEIKLLTQYPRDSFLFALFFIKVKAIFQKPVSVTCSISYNFLKLGNFWLLPFCLQINMVSHTCLLQFSVLILCYNEKPFVDAMPTNIWL